jgi:hypothetical protein
MKLTDEQLERCGLCYSTCKCYRTLNDQPYCGATGKLTNEEKYCHALESTKGTKIINPFENFPNRINYDGSRSDKLVDEIGESNCKILKKCADLRGSYVLLYRMVHEFNWFVRVINLGNLVKHDDCNYLFNKYHKYSDGTLDELIEQFENYCKERYGEQS